MVLSKKQETALRIIGKIYEKFGERWFIQAELPTITLHTMDALVEKGYLVTDILEYNYMTYYKLVKPNPIEE